MLPQPLIYERFHVSGFPPRARAFSIYNECRKCEHSVPDLFPQSKRGLCIDQFDLNTMLVEPAKLLDPFGNARRGLLPVFGILIAGGVVDRFLQA